MECRHEYSTGAPVSLEFEFRPLRPRPETSGRAYARAAVIAISYIVLFESIVHFIHHAFLSHFIPKQLPTSAVLRQLEELGCDPIPARPSPRHSTKTARTFLVRRKQWLLSKESSTLSRRETEIWQRATTARTNKLPIRKQALRLQRKNSTQCRKKALDSNGSSNASENESKYRVHYFESKIQLRLASREESEIGHDALWRLIPRMTAACDAVAIKKAENRFVHFRRHRKSSLSTSTRKAVQSALW